MLELYFGNVISILTLLLVAGMLLFAALSIKNHVRISRWGRLIALFLLVGTAISALSATRDGYATPKALFAMDSIQSTVCSVAGGLLFLTGIISIFLKNQSYKRICFHILSGLFLVQVLVIEASRVIMMG